QLNTVSTAGFTITKLSSTNEIAARGEGDGNEENNMNADQPPSPRTPPAVRGATKQELTFKLLASDAKGALYEASNNNTSGDGVSFTYYYLFPQGTPPDSFSLQRSWDLVGAYVFLNIAEDPRVLLPELGNALSRQDTNFSRLAWRISAGVHN